MGRQYAIINAQTKEATTTGMLNFETVLYRQSETLRKRRDIGDVPVYLRHVSCVNSRAKEG